MNTPLAAARRFAVATTTTALTLAAAGLSPAANALGLGNIEVLSGLNQPLRAVVPLLLEEGETAQQLDLAIARDDEASKFGALPNLLGQEVDVVLSLQGARMEALITTKYPVKEPHLDVVLHAKLGETKHLRIYPVLLDLPLAFFEPEETDNSYLSDLKYRSAWNGEPSDQQASQMNEPASIASLDIDGATAEPFAVGSLPPPFSNDDAFEETVTFDATFEDDVAREREIAGNETSATELRDEAQSVNEPRETAVADATFESRAEAAFRAAFAGPKTNVEIEIEDNEVYAVQLTPEAEVVGVAMEDAVTSSVIPDDIWQSADGDDTTRLDEMDSTAVYATQLTPEAQSIGLPLDLDGDSAEPAAAVEPTAAAEPATVTATPASTPTPVVDPAPAVQTANGEVDIENMDFRVAPSATPAEVSVAVEQIEALDRSAPEASQAAAAPAASEPEAVPAPTDVAIEDMDFRVNSTPSPEVVSSLDPTPSVAADTPLNDVNEAFGAVDIDIAVFEVDDSLGATPPTVAFNGQTSAAEDEPRVMPAIPTEAVEPSAATAEIEVDSFTSSVELATWAGIKAHLPLPETVLLSEVPDNLGSPVKIEGLPRTEALRRLSEEDSLTD